MQQIRATVVCLVIGVALTGCAAPAPAGGGVAPGRETRTQRTAVMVLGGAEGELNRILEAGVNPNRARRTLFNAGLARDDPRGVWQPHLAEALPELNTDSWRLLPDGRMQTVYRLKPNLTWHDGAPLSAQDFVFAWRVYTTPELAISGVPPQSLMEEAVALDERTLEIRWRQPYSQANSLGVDEFPPLPQRILEPRFRQVEPGAFANHPYWTTEFVGVGPYRLDRWEPGAFQEGVAFDGYVFGRPKIDRIRLLVIQDDNTTLANLLAGQAHLAVDTIKFAQAMVLKREWAPQRTGAIFLMPDITRHIQIQIRPEYVNPRALLDVRVRKAIAHTVDKQALNDGVFDGQGVIAEAMVRPTTASYAEVERSMVRYPYDLRRAEQLLNEAGYAKAADGLFAHPVEGRLSPEARVRPGSQNEQELVIMTDGWRRAGIDAIPRVLSSGEFSDQEFKAKFPGIFTTATGSDEGVVRIFHSSAIPRVETRWTGLNLAGWSNPEYDRLYDVFTTTLDRGERTRLLAQMLRLVSEGTAMVPLYFTVRVVAHANALQGPQAPSTEGQAMWNVHEWEFR